MLFWKASFTHMVDRTQFAAIALMGVGLLLLTVVPDVTSDLTTADQRAGLAVIGGVLVFGAGGWAYYDIDRGGKMDERYVKIHLRAAFLAWWGTFWIVLTLDFVLEDVALSLPVGSTLTWIGMASLVLYVLGVPIFERLM